MPITRDWQRELDAEDERLRRAQAIAEDPSEIVHCDDCEGLCETPNGNRDVFTGCCLCFIRGFKENRPASYRGANPTPCNICKERAIFDSIGRA